MDAPRPTIRIGSRRSQLAQAQASCIVDALRALHPDRDFKLHLLGSPGDRDRKEALRNFGGTGAFVKDIEGHLLDDGVDVAVHSLKDLPTRGTDALTIAAVPRREDPSDALCGARLREVPHGGRVGTGSVRRRAQLLAVRPDLDVVPIRGNVPPRLRAIEDHSLAATVLATAGLIRLQLESRISEQLDVDAFVPAAGQGALAVQCRADDAEIIKLLKPLEDPTARICVELERNILHGLHAGCNAPVGVLAAAAAGCVLLRCQVLSADGATQIRFAREAASGNVGSLEAEALTYLRRQGARELIAAAAAESPASVDLP
jgi:hydroxymethylbilane synthase